MQADNFVTYPCGKPRGGKLIDFRTALAVILYIFVMIHTAAVEFKSNHAVIPFAENTFLHLHVVAKLATRKQQANAYKQNNN